MLLIQFQSFQSSRPVIISNLRLFTPSALKDELKFPQTQYPQLFLQVCNICNILEPESPDADGDKTLRRQPRKSESGQSRSSPPSSEPEPETPNYPPTSHADYIRTLTDRLSLTYDF